MNFQQTAVVQTATVSSAATDALLKAALEAASGLGFEAAVAVVDAGGALKGFTRSDGAAFLTVDVAIGKAWTAASYGYPTHVWNEYVADPKVAPLANLPRMMPVGGGYPLLHEGKVVGGIGISGGNYQQDQDAAANALRQLGFEIAGA